MSVLGAFLGAPRNPSTNVGNMAENPFSGLPQTTHFGVGSKTYIKVKKSKSTTRNEYVWAFLP